MRSRVFVDTSAWKALYDKDDPCHKIAKRTLADLKRKGSFIFTSNYVVDETLTLLRIRVDHLSAIEFGEYVRASKVTSTLAVDNAIENEAWVIFKKYWDKTFRFTDCTSFALMRKLSLDSAFTLDEHFRQFGLISVPNRRNIQNALRGRRFDQ